MQARWVAAALVLGLAGTARGQTIILPEPGQMPPQVIPAAADPGTPEFSVTPGGDVYGGSSTAPTPLLDGYPTGVTGGMGPGGTTNYGGTPTVDRGDVLASLQSQPYGATAVSTAEKLGINSTGVAAFAAAESDFRNIATANGSTSATGPWQITAPTWDDTVKRFNLPYTAADRADPNAQAVVSSYIIRSYGGATSQALNRVATVQETYYSYVYGPSVGAKIAGADPSTPLSSFVAADNLANNGMTGWTVQNLQDFTSRRLGPSYAAPIFAAKS